MDRIPPHLLSAATLPASPPFWAHCLVFTSSPLAVLPTLKMVLHVR